MSRKARIQLAHDLEAALRNAAESGASGEQVLHCLGACVGYCVANGNPDEKSVQRSLDFVCAVIGESAARTFMERGGGMETAGNA